MNIKLEPSRKLIVFDLDGTLADTFTDIANAANHALEMQKKTPLPIETVTSYVGRGMRNLLIDTFALDRENLDNEVLKQANKDASDYYSKHLTDNTKLYPGATETLEQLKAASVKMAILSNKPDHLTKPIVENLNLSKFFDLVLGKKENFPVKPDPQSLLYIIEQLDSTPENTTMIGDSPSDINVAQNCGTKFIGVSFGTYTIEQLKQHGAEKIVDHLPDLLNLI